MALINKYRGIVNSVTIDEIIGDIPNVYIVEKDIITILYYHDYGNYYEFNNTHLHSRDLTHYTDIRINHDKFTSRDYAKKYCVLCDTYKFRSWFCGYLGNLNICANCLKNRDMSYLSIGPTNNKPATINPEPKEPLKNSSTYNVNDRSATNKNPASKLSEELKSNIIFPSKVKFNLGDVSYLTMVSQPWLI